MNKRVTIIILSFILAIVFFINAFGFYKNVTNYDEKKYIKSIANMDANDLPDEFQYKDIDVSKLIDNDYTVACLGYTCYIDNHTNTIINNDVYWFKTEKETLKYIIDSEIQEYNEEEIDKTSSYSKYVVFKTDKYIYTT